MITTVFSLEQTCIKTFPSWSSIPDCVLLALLFPCNCFIEIQFLCHKIHQSEVYGFYYNCRVVYTSPSNNFRTFSFAQKDTFHFLGITLPTFSPPANSNIPVSVNLLKLGISCKENLTVFVLCFLVYFTFVM